MPRLPVLASVPLAVGLAAGALVGCTSDGSAGGGGAVRVEASFYPLQWMAQQVGGDHVEVSNLTRPGTEPHDLELSPRAVAALADADVIVYLSGFQPAVDDAVAGSGATAFDAADRARLHDTSAAGGAGAADPHFWLDPTRLADVAEAFAATLAEEDPGHAADYRAGAKALVAELEELDRDLESGLADCEHEDLVTTHEAFGYLAERYGLREVGIAGLIPEAEPSPGQLAEITRFVRDHDVRTIYVETLADPSVADAIAAEADVETDVLDPIEGLDDDSQGRDYLQVMRADLENLRAGQRCS